MSPQPYINKATKYKQISESSVLIDIDSEQDLYVSFAKNSLITDYNVIKNKEEHTNITYLMPESDIFDMQLKSHYISKLITTTITNQSG